MKEEQRVWKDVLNEKLKRVGKDEPKKNGYNASWSIENTSL